MREMTSANLVGSPEEKEPLESSRHIWEHNI
jgi:hypothetical protein